MPNEIESKKNSPAFSVRINITDTEKEIVFTGSGNEDTVKLFLTVLRRLEKRMDKSEIFEKSFYDMDKINEDKVEIYMSKENIEQLLEAILLL